MEYNIRSYVILITGLYLGVPTLCWAACTFHRHRRSSGKESIFIVTLLFNDALQLLLDVLFLADDFGGVLESIDHSAHFFPYMHGLVRLLGLWLHQLVALEGAVSVSHSKYAAVFSSVPCSVCVTLTALLVVSMVQFFRGTFHLTFVFLIVVPLLNNGVMCFLMCLHKFKSPQVMTRGMTGNILGLLAVSLVSYFILYGPYLLIQIICISASYLDQDSCTVWLLPTYSIITFRVIADCLLSVLVCRLPRILFSQIKEGTV